MHGCSSVIRRNTTFLGVIFLGAFATEMYGYGTPLKGKARTDKPDSAFETTANSIWDRINKGVC
jgi:hypothetical protein